MRAGRTRAGPRTGWPSPRRHALVAVGGDGGDDRPDPPPGVGAAGGAVLVGRGPEGLEGQVDHVAPLEVASEAQLDHRAGVEHPGAGGGEVLLLVAPAGDVVLEQPARRPAQVVAGEEGHHGEALHGRREVVAHHLAELVGLALEREVLALDLLVVLQLELEEGHHLDRGAGGTGDGHARPAVGGEHLLDGAVADEVAGGGPPVTRHDHPVGVADGHDRRAVGREEVGRHRVLGGSGARPTRRTSPAKSGPGSSWGLNCGNVTGPTLAALPRGPAPGTARRGAAATGRPSGRRTGRSPRRWSRARRRSHRAARRCRP